jgi:3-oxosteroid 1-dehydrogenase
MAHMNEFVGNQMALPPTDPDPAGMQTQLAKPHAFLVDQSGTRYMNEGGSYMLFCQGQLERHKTVPAVPSWMIMDSQFMRRYMLCETMPNSKKPPIWLDSGFLKKADTLEGLARECNLPPEALVATTEKFNRFARQGKDEEFGRGDSANDRFLGDYTHGPNDTLGTVEEGPFFAVQIVPGDVGTYGGVVCDSNARVMKPDGSIIEALYATGTTTAGVMGRAYPGAGCSIGPSFTWGFVSAKHAANLGNLGV